MTGRGWTVAGFKFVVVEGRDLRIGHPKFLWHLGHKRATDPKHLNPHRLCTDSENVYQRRGEMPLHGVTDDRAQVTCPDCLVAML